MFRFTFKSLLLISFVFFVSVFLYPADDVEAEATCTMIFMETIVGIEVGTDAYQDPTLGTWVCAIDDFSGPSGTPSNEGTLSAGFNNNSGIYGGIKTVAPGAPVTIYAKDSVDERVSTSCPIITTSLVYTVNGVGMSISPVGTRAGGTSYYQGAGSGQEASWSFTAPSIPGSYSIYIGSAQWFEKRSSFIGDGCSGNLVSRHEFRGAESARLTLVVVEANPTADLRVRKSGTNWDKSVNVNGTESVELNPVCTNGNLDSLIGPGGQPISGNTHSPTQSGVYTLECVGGENTTPATDTASVIVEVESTPSGEIRFTNSPITVNEGQIFTLAWTSSNIVGSLSKTGVMFAGTTNANTTGSQNFRAPQVSSNTTRSYTLSGTGEDGGAVSVTETVNVANVPKGTINVTHNGGSDYTSGSYSILPGVASSASLVRGGSASYTVSPAASGTQYSFAASTGGDELYISINGGQHQLTDTATFFVEDGDTVNVDFYYEQVPTTANLVVRSTCPVSTTYSFSGTGTPSSASNQSISAGGTRSHSISMSTSNVTYSVSPTSPNGYTASVSPTQAPIAVGSSQTFTISCVVDEAPNATVTVSSNLATTYSLRGTGSPSNPSGSISAGGSATTNIDIIGDYDWYSVVPAQKSGHTVSVSASWVYLTPGIQRSVSITYTPITPTLTLTANPEGIIAGNPTTLSWSSSNTNSCSASWTSSRSTSGSANVSPTSDTTYTITCTGAGGSDTDTASVNVSPANATIEVTSNRSTSYVINGTGDPFTISDTVAGGSTNTHSITLDGSSDSYSLSASSIPGYSVTSSRSSMNLTPGSTERFELTYTGLSGTCDISTDATQVGSGESFTLTWGGTNLTSAQALDSSPGDGVWGNKEISTGGGTEVITAPIITPGTSSVIIYSLNCTYTNGTQGSDNVSVTVTRDIDPLTIKVTSNRDTSFTIYPDTTIGRQMTGASISAGETKTFVIPNPDPNGRIYTISHSKIQGFNDSVRSYIQRTSQAYNRGDNFVQKIFFALTEIAFAQSGGGGSSTMGEDGDTIEYVIEYEGEVSATIDANPKEIEISEETTLTWSSENATSCDASGNWNEGDIGTSGSEGVTPQSTGDNTYIITCSNDEGEEATDQVTVTVTGEITQCNDGSDNDGDGLTDSNDPDCGTSGGTSEFTPVACNNGVDDDGDGDVDMSDSSCSSTDDNSELNPRPLFDLSVSPSSIALPVDATESESAQIAISSFDGYTGTVTITADFEEGPLEGATIIFPSEMTAGSVDYIYVEVTEGIKEESYAILITATGEVQGDDPGTTSDWTVFENITLGVEQGGNPSFEEF